MDARTDEPCDEDELARQRAETLFTLGRYSEALVIATTLVASRPDDPRPWTLLGRCQAGAGAADAAAVSAERAIAFAPDHALIHVWASHVFRGAGKGRRALDLAMEAVRLAPDLVTAHVAVASHATDIAHGRAQRRPRGSSVPPDDVLLWQRAHWHAGEAVRLDPTDAQALFMAAYVDLRSGHHARARRGFRAVLAVEPTCLVSQNNLAVLEMRRMRLSRASSALIGVVGANPRDDRALRNVGRVAARQVAAAHAFFWLLYSCSVVAGAVGSSGPLRWQLTWHGEAVVVVLGASVGLASRVWCTTPPGLRHFVRARLLSPWQRRIMLTCDLFMGSLMLISAASGGALSWEAPAAGLVLTVPTIAVLVRAGAADHYWTPLRGGRRRMNRETPPKR